MPAESRRVQRSIFYANTSFGSLAWIANSAKRSAARSRLFVEDLSVEDCVELPKRGVPWFAINHSEADIEGQVGYFSVRIIYRFNAGQRSADSRTGIHLQRNGNWFDVDGKQVAREYERAPEQIGLSEAEFINLHDPMSSAASANLRALEHEIGNWHMKPTLDGDSSWSGRYLYGPMLRAYLTTSTGAISARLIRFTATASTNSDEPVLFWLDPRGATSATILIDAPTQTYVGSNRVYTVTFGEACPSQ